MPPAIIYGLPVPKHAQGSQLLFIKAYPYAQWEPYWTSDHRLVFIDRDQTAMVRYDWQKATFGPEEAILSKTQEGDRLTINHDRIVTAINSRIPQFSNHHGEYTAAIKLSDGDILLAGGYSLTKSARMIERYNTKTHLYTPVGEMTRDRFGVNLILMPNQSVLIAGGATGSLGEADGAEPIYSIELFRP